VIRGGEVSAHHPEERLQEPLGLTEWQVEKETERQCGFDGAERRRRIADDLYDGLLSGGYRFWEDVHRLFTSRDISRAELRQLIRRGLATTGGNYRTLLKLFGLEQEDYKRLMNFLAAHECVVDYREFRQMPNHAAVQ
jgi:hypothetical protein